MLANGRCHPILSPSAFSAVSLIIIAVVFLLLFVWLFGHLHAVKRVLLLKGGIVFDRVTDMFNSTMREQLLHLGVFA
jgi:hypothetical protein